MSYAAHQEAVAQALHQLITDPQPLDPQRHRDGPRLPRPSPQGPARTPDLPRRQQPEARDRLQRDRHLPDPPSGAPPRPRAGRPSTSTRAPGRTLASSSALRTPPPRNEPGSRWRTVARGLLLGTAELTRADHQPWTHQPAAGWHLVGDTASTLEALLVLDDRLTAAGHLPHDPDADRRHDPMAQRLVVTQAARLASWYGTDPTADLATSSIRHELGVGGHPPVTLVRQAGDFARGATQPGRPAPRTSRAPAARLRPAPRPAGRTRPGHRPDPPRHRLRQRRRPTRTSPRSPSSSAPGSPPGGPCTSPPPGSPKSRSGAPHSCSPNSPRWSSRCAPPPPDRLTAADLRDLNRATHELTVTLGRALRHEALETHNIVALDSEHLGLPRPEPMTSTGWAFTAACQRLADEPATARPRAPGRRATPARAAATHAGGDRDRQATAAAGHAALLHQRADAARPPPRPQPTSQPVTARATTPGRVPTQHLRPAHPHTPRAIALSTPVPGVARTGGQR